MLFRLRGVQIPAHSISIKTSFSISTLWFSVMMTASRRGVKAWQTKKKKEEKQAKIQAQAPNPEGASLTLDEGGSFVDRCTSECISSKALEGCALLLRRCDAACFSGGRVGQRGLLDLSTGSLVRREAWPLVWSVNRERSGSSELPWLYRAEMLMLELRDSRLSQFWTRASCDQLYKCWLSRRRITGAEQPGVYCLPRARERERERQKCKAAKVQKFLIHPCICGVLPSCIMIKKKTPEKMLFTQSPVHSWNLDSSMCILFGIFFLLPCFQLVCLARRSSQHLTVLIFQVNTTVPPEGRTDATPNSSDTLLETRLNR